MAKSATVTCLPSSIVENSGFHSSAELVSPTFFILDFLDGPTVSSFPLRLSGSRAFDELGLTPMITSTSAKIRSVVGNGTWLMGGATIAGGSAVDTVFFWPRVLILEPHHVDLLPKRMGYLNSPHVLRWSLGEVTGVLVV